MGQVKCGDNRFHHSGVRIGDKNEHSFTEKSVELSE